MAGGVEYQVTKVDPTSPQTKGMVHQVHKVSEEIAATIGGKVYRARIINDPTAPTVAGKVYQIVLIDDPDDPSVKGMVYNAILTGGSEAVVVGPAVSPLALDDAIADTMEYVKAYGGTGQNGTPTPDTPINIVCNNGAVYYSPNMYNKDYEYERIYGFFASTGTTWSYADQGYSIRIACQPNTTYTARYNGNSTQAVLGFGSTSNDNVPAQGSSVTVTQCIRQSSPTISTPVTLTTGANDKWLIIAFNVADPQHTDMMENLQVEKGAVPSAYKPYHGVGVYTSGPIESIADSTNHTATCENLFSVDTYTDVQEILSGDVTRKNAVVVLDGTESWSQATTSQGVYRYRFVPTGAPKIDGGRGHCMSTHFFDIGDVSTQDVGGIFASTTYLYFIPDQTTDTVTKWTDWLKAQYAAGTPVIVIYPLATETTESVTGQTLQVQDGDNVLTITQAGMSGLQIEAKYEKEVE